LKNNLAIRILNKKTGTEKKLAFSMRHILFEYFPERYFYRTETGCMMRKTGELAEFRSRGEGAFFFLERFMSPAFLMLNCQHKPPVGPDGGLPVKSLRKRDLQYLTLYVTKSILIQFESCYSFYTLAAHLSP
jgi:hypothetical protein